MITAGEAKRKREQYLLIEQKTVDTCQERNKDYIPESCFTLGMVEEKIYHFIKDGFSEFQDKLSDDVISTLKTNGYKIYLCKAKNLTYHNVFTGNGFKMRPLTSFIYVTVVIWDENTFNKDKYVTYYYEVKEL